jgi:diaminohydroxyphosphoribosylaminopyrimidine deaminase/5-amino-6-(5-phosphoribosylamino)uracil reductase
VSGAIEADRRWLTEAIELSRRAPPTPTNFAVGAIVVDRRGSVLATGHTGEFDLRIHAEEAALAKLAGRELGGSTVYSSLEPCTTRRSRPDTCTDLILAARIKRVVIALREPLLFADCHGVELLRDAGVEVVELGDLGHLVQEINAHVLGSTAESGQGVGQERGHRLG